MAFPVMFGELRPREDLAEPNQDDTRSLFGIGMQRRPSQSQLSSSNQQQPPSPSARMRRQRRKAKLPEEQGCCYSPTVEDKVVAEIDRLATVRPPQLPQEDPIARRSGAPDPVPTPVYLNVYHLVEPQTNKRLKIFGMGVFHSGVQVFDEEWSFGAPATPQDTSGVFSIPPMEAAGTLHCHLFLGNTYLTREQFKTLIRRLSVEWPAIDYHVLGNNCNTFCERFVQLLSAPERPLVFPRWINRASRWSDALVPRGLATYVLAKVTKVDPPRAHHVDPNAQVGTDVRAAARAECRIDHVAMHYQVLGVMKTSTAKESMSYSRAASVASTTVLTEPRSSNVPPPLSARNFTGEHHGTPSQSPVGKTPPRRRSFGNVPRPKLSALYVDEMPPPPPPKHPPPAPTDGERPPPPPRHPPPTDHPSPGLRRTSSASSFRAISPVMSSRGVSPHGHGYSSQVRPTSPRRGATTPTSPRRVSLSPRRACTTSPVAQMRLVAQSPRRGHSNAVPGQSPIRTITPVALRAPTVVEPPKSPARTKKAPTVSAPPPTAPPPSSPSRAKVPGTKPTKSAPVPPRRLSPGRLGGHESSNNQPSLPLEEVIEPQPSKPPPVGPASQKSTTSMDTDQVESPQVRSPNVHQDAVRLTNPGEIPSPSPVRVVGLGARRITFAEDADSRSPSHFPASPMPRSGNVLAGMHHLRSPQAEESVEPADAENLSGTAVLGAQARAVNDRTPPFGESTDFNNNNNRSTVAPAALTPSTSQISAPTHQPFGGSASATAAELSERAAGSHSLGNSSTSSPNFASVSAIVPALDATACGTFVPEAGNAERNKADTPGQCGTHSRHDGSASPTSSTDDDGLLSVAPSTQRTKAKHLRGGGRSNGQGPDEDELTFTYTDTAKGLAHTTQPDDATHTEFLEAPTAAQCVTDGGPSHHRSASAFPDNSSVASAGVADNRGFRNDDDTELPTMEDDD